jgi:hypothetical protein
MRNRVDIDNPRKVLDTGFVAVRCNLDTGVIDEEIQPTPFTEDGIKHAVNVFFFAHIALNQDVANAVLLHPIAAPLNCFLGLFRFVFVTLVIDGNICTVFGKFNGNGLPDATAGDGHRLALNAFHGFPSWLTSKRFFAQVMPPPILSNRFDGLHPTRHRYRHENTHGTGRNRTSLGRSGNVQCRRRPDDGCSHLAGRWTPTVGQARLRLRLTSLDCQTRWGIRP